MIVDDAEDFCRVIYKDFCAGFEQFVRGSITPYTADRKHPR